MTRIHGRKAKKKAFMAVKRGYKEWRMKKRVLRRMAYNPVEYAWNRTLLSHPMPDLIKNFAAFRPLPCGVTMKLQRYRENP